MRWKAFQIFLLVNDISHTRGNQADLVRVVYTDIDPFTL